MFWARISLTTSRRRKAEFRHLLRIEPDAHRIVAGAEQLHLSDAVDAGEPVLDVDQRVVAQIGHVVATFGRGQVHDHHQVGRALDGGDAEAAHLLRQARFGLADAVLDELLRLVGIGAELEGHGQRHQAVGGRLAAHIEHVLDAVDRFLQRCRYGFGDDLRVGAGIVGAHDERGRHDVRIFRNRQDRHRDQAAEEDDEG